MQNNDAQPVDKLPRPLDGCPYCVTRNHAPIEVGATEGGDALLAGYGCPQGHYWWTTWDMEGARSVAALGPVPE